MPYKDYHCQNCQNNLMVCKCTLADHVAAAEKLEKEDICDLCHRDFLACECTILDFTLDAQRRFTEQGITEEVIDEVIQKLESLDTCNDCNRKAIDCLCDVGLDEIAEEAIMTDLAAEFNAARFEL